MVPRTKTNVEMIDFAKEKAVGVRKVAEHFHTLKSSVANILNLRNYGQLTGR